MSETLAVLRTSMALPSWQPSPSVPCCSPVTLFPLIDPEAPSKRIPARLSGNASQAVARLAAVTFTFCTVAFAPSFVTTAPTKWAPGGSRAVMVCPAPSMV